MLPLRKSRDPEGRARVGDVTGRKTKGGLVQVTVSLDPRHLAALRAEALRRAAASGSGRLDASAVLRELLDAWLAKAKR